MTTAPKILICLLTAAIGIATSCSGSEQEISTSELPDYAQALVVRTLLNGSSTCPTDSGPCRPMLRISNNGVGDSIRGKAFCSNQALAQLAACNDLKRKVTLRIFNNKRTKICQVTRIDADTLYFAYAYPKAEEISQAGYQKLRVTLQTSYGFNHKQMVYDTTLLRVDTVRVR